MINRIIDIIKDKNILILGFGREGKTTYNFIREYLPNKKVTILDENSVTLGDDNTEVIITNITHDILKNYDLIFKSPGISLKNIDTDDLNITSQLELLLEVNRKNVIGVTGTKGKSTTSSLIYSVIKNFKDNTYLLGNIGTPIFEMIDNFDDDTTLVIECSSHQLEFIKTSPHIGIILNLHPEHLDHYRSLNDYYNAKLNMFKYQNSNDYILYDDSIKDYIDADSIKIDINKDIFIKDSNVYIKKGNVDVLVYDTNSKRKLLGDHNLNNILFVLMIVDILGYDIKKSVEIINNFEPLEHRMEYVGKYNGIDFYNDSIATIPDATINCVNAIKGVDTLILGGNDRGLDYTDLIQFVNNSNLENIICLPKTAHDYMDKLTKKTYKVESLEEAVKIAKKVTKHVCVLSPAASSYGYFKNFEERGKLFKELVRKD